MFRRYFIVMHDIEKKPNIMRERVLGMSVDEIILDNKL